MRRLLTIVMDIILLSVLVCGLLAIWGLRSVNSHEDVPATVRVSQGQVSIIDSNGKTEHEGSNEVEVELEAKKAIAQKPTEALETIRRQLTKLGNTPFGCDQVKIDFRKPYFLPVSLLNQLRRGVCDRLMEVREANRPRSQGQILKNNVPYPYSSLDFTENVLNEKARAFYRRHGATCKEPAAESGMDMERRRVMTSRYCIKKELGLCGVSLTERGFTEPLYLVDEDGHRLILEFNCRNCEMAIYFEKRD